MHSRSKENFIKLNVTKLQNKVRQLELNLVEANKLAEEERLEMMAVQKQLKIEVCDI